MWTLNHLGSVFLIITYFEFCVAGFFLVTLFYFIRIEVVYMNA
nr:MAG TPA: hypothetical protein [Caudoviricetes sp.]DAV58483.1 MAG TPA: hypothetical protein [Caudoviricetes sp.]DAY58646.1 MAG TPA: hypothetical protein [Caudoviricetes sp.]